ncbi:MAG: hypothetical protein PWP55_914, partial [Clostridiales bacterium]|nr:hypothetical protein [Clostridiales bacterium]
MRKISLNKGLFVVVIILASFAITMIVANNFTSSKIKAENSSPDEPMPLSEEDILKRAEKIVLELERSMPTIRGIPKSIWSEE